MTSRRRTFLPTTLRNSELAEVDGWDLYPHKWKYHGFDQSGQFYSIVDGPITKRHYLTAKIVFLFYNHEENTVQKRFVILGRGHTPVNFSEMLYDPYFTRWFYITSENTALNEEIDKHRIVVNSGCIEKVTSTRLCRIEFGTKIKMDEPICNKNHLVLEFDQEPKVIFADISRYTDHGSYLVLMTCQNSGPSQNHKQIHIDLLKYDMESLSYYKRIILNHQRIERYFDTRMFENDYSIFFDFAAEHVYIANKHRRRGLRYILDCFNFEGELVFSHKVPEESNGLGYRFFGYLRCEFFIAVTTELNVKLFRAAIAGITKVKEYPLCVSVPATHYKYYVDFRVARFFQRDILEVRIKIFHEINTINPHVSSRIHVFDVGSGKQIIKPLGIEKEISSYAFNWSLSEVMYTSGYHFDSYQSFGTHTKTISNFVKTQSMDVSLKHQARIACLRHFTGDCLNSILPKCILEYLGITF